MSIAPLLAALLVILCAMSLACAPTTAGLAGPTRGWSYELDGQSGHLTRLRQDTFDWLAGPTSFVVFDETNDRPLPLTLREVQALPDDAVTTAWQGDGLAAAITFRRRDQALEVRCEVTNQGRRQDLGATLRWTLPLADTGMKVFVTDENNHHSFDDLAEPRKFTYPFMAFPMWTAYDGQRGLSVVRDPKERIPRQAFVMKPGGVLEASATNVWLRPGRTVTATYFLVPHAGCWRAGLRWFRDRYRDMLAVKTPWCWSRRGRWRTGAPSATNPSITWRGRAWHGGKSTARTSQWAPSLPRRSPTTGAGTSVW